VKPGLYAFVATMVAAIASPPPARADGMGPHEFDLAFGGYGELGAAYYDHGLDASRPGGARDDRRLEFDSTRFVAVMEATMPIGLEVEAELEIEHGGTGAAREIEYEEFGEYESEVEKGGEVQLEELYIKRTFAGKYQVAAGRFYVALGHLNAYFRPPDYLSARRSEAETTIFPGQWDEMGVSFTAFLGAIRVTAQVVNGLDSAGFGSRAWVSSGHQGAYELVRASDLAGVARVDYELGPGTIVGVAGYLGGSSRNRPKADLTRDCSDPDNDNVAPCGYIPGKVAIGEAHARWKLGRLRGQALFVYGHLENADEISARNDRLSNEAGVERTPVGDNAVAFAAEAGYDIAPALGACADNAIEPFARFDYYDTMVNVRDSLFDNPRFERKVVGAGVAYTYKRVVTGKLDVERRWFGSSDLRAEHTVRLTAGFVY
jgi:hypothetical protein